MNKNVFKTATPIQKANAVNKAGGKAYDTGAEHSLAQYACTGTFGGSYYETAEKELTEVISLAQKVSPEFLAKCAVYSRKNGYMKDMPVVLLAVLSTIDTKLFKLAFPQVIDNGHMARNFVQVMRSGTVGRRSLGSAPKKMLKKWFERSSNDYLFKQSVGNNPSLADVIKMIHPSPADEETSNLYSYLLGKGYDAKKKLPKLVHEFEAFKAAALGNSNKKNKKRIVPDVPFQMLTSLELTDAEWGQIAKNGNWQFTRMNLNNFNKHGLFNNAEMTDMIAKRLANPEEVSKSRAFPYQLFQAYRNTVDVPNKVRNALQEAMDLAVDNTPQFDTMVHIGVDSSGSMGSPVNPGAFSHTAPRINCNEVAALYASAIYRNNDEAKVYIFDTTCREVKNLNPRDSVMSNTVKISANGGGTSCESFLNLLNKNGAKGDLVIMVSDNESWYSATGVPRWGGEAKATAFQAAWKSYKARNPKALLVCIDLTPGMTAQATGKDVLLVGGFSDNVFNVVSKFYESRGDSKFWVNEINESVEL